MCGRLLASSWQINQKWLLATLVFIVPFFAASQQDIPEIHIDEIDPYEEELIDFSASRTNERGPSTRGKRVRARAWFPLIERGEQWPQVRNSLVLHTSFM